MTLEVKELSVSYGNLEVLEDISFKLDNGQIVGLVAPNGTGKTTLFNAIMRFIPITKGEILIDDVAYSDSDQDVLALHQLITFFPDQADLFENFSGREHIKIYAQMWSGRVDEVDQIIERLRMDHYVDRKVEEYSLGMRQRLCFAMMVAADTPIMLMDEVMNGLDPENVSLVSSILIELRKSGKIIMIASHLLDNLDEYADQVFFLKDKKLHAKNNLNEERPLYYLIVCSKEDVAMLRQEGFLSRNSYHIDGQLLCIPLEDLSAESEIALYKRIRTINSQSIEIAPLGTAEQYSILYDLQVHSYDRSEYDD
jgi:ABC-2 type transport system ATP-binding protein